MTTLGVEMVLDETNNEPYEDEKTHEGMKFKIPAESYYNQTERKFFDSNELDDRFKFCLLRFEIIPKIVSLPYTFIQDSSYEALAQAEEKEKKLEIEYKDKFIRCCVDTINYDPWEMTIERLRKLFCIWSKVSADDKGEIEIPPIELTDMTNAKCESCGKLISECKCEKLKLCTKCYPLDLYGLTGKNKIGEMPSDKNSSMYGMFTTCGYLYDQADHPLTFAEIAKTVYEAVLMQKTKELVNVEEFSVTSQFSLAVLSISYRMLRNSSAVEIPGSILNRFSEASWKNFIKQYSIGLSNGKNMNSVKFSIEYKVGIADGYAYIPTGYDIMFEYDIMSNSLIINGSTPAETAMLMTLATCSEEQYNAMWKPLSIACSPLSEDEKKFIAYPYMPSIVSIFNGEDDKIDNPSEYDEKYVYIADPDNVKEIVSGVFKGKAPLRFAIYIKRPVLCSYPKESTPSCRNKSNEGFCGLRELFERPYIVSPSSFDLEKEVLKRTTRKKRIKMKEISKDLKEDVALVKNGACNVTKNLQKIDEIQNAAMGEVIDFSNDYKGLLSMIGRDMTSDDSQSSILCESLLKEGLKSIMIDYDQVFSHSAKSAEVIGDESFNKTKEAIANAMKDFTTINDSLKNTMMEVALAFPIYMICNKKYNDYLTEQNTSKSFDVSLVEKAKTEYSKSIIKSIKSRTGNNAVRDNVKKLAGLKDSVKEELIEKIKSGDIDGIKALIQSNKALQEAVGNEAGSLDDKAMDLIKKMNEPTSKASSAAKALDKVTNEKLNSGNCLKSLLEKFTSPLNLTKGMNVALDISKCVAKMVKAITNGIQNGITTTIEQIVYPLLGLEVPTKSNSKKSALSSLSSVDDLVKNASKGLKSVNDIKSNAKSMIASAIVSNASSMIISSCGSYISSTSIGAAALGGVGGALSSKDDLKKAAVTGASQSITGSLNIAIEKTGLKDIIESVLKPLLSKIPGMGNRSSEVAKNICDSLPGNVGQSIGNDLNKSLTGSGESTLKNVKSAVDANPMLNEIVSSIIKKTNGETSNQLMAFANGSSSMNVGSQNNDATKAALKNGSVESDALTQMHKFIRDNTKLYQQITGQFITFDSK